MIPLKPPEAITISIITKIGGRNASISRFEFISPFSVYSHTVFPTSLPTILNPSNQAAALNGLCGTLVNTPPATIAIPKLRRTWRVKKASKIASTGGTILYHIAFCGSCPLGGAKRAARAHITPKIITAAALFVNSFDFNDPLLL